MDETQAAGALAKLPPGLIVSAPASGAGKTTITLGLARALARRGRAVQAFKCGPDYIDTAFHACATGRPSFNLDTWSMSHPMLERILGAAVGSDIAIAEGAMGLFDGVRHKGAFGNGASADLAALTGWPVILVIDCTAQAQTAAAVASGLAHFRPEVRILGVVLNRVAGERHYDLVRDGFEGCGIDILGWLPRKSGLAIPERHLGLVQARETEALDGLLDGLADVVETHVDLDRLTTLLENDDRARAPVALASSGAAVGLTPPGARIAIAQDAAFSFVYPHMLDAWRASGAEILPFSPLADQAPDPDADVCWLPGGYPELHAGRIAAARGFLGGLRTFAETRPVHGECGGYMVLGDALIDKEGHAHQMVRLVGLVTSFEKRKLHLGYRSVRLLQPMPGYAPGAALRGHEFHYSSIIAQPDVPLAVVEDAAGGNVADTGSRRGLVTGTFFHLVAEAVA